MRSRSLRGTRLTRSVVHQSCPYASVEQHFGQLVRPCQQPPLIIREIYRNQTDGGLYGSLLWRESRLPNRIEAADGASA